MRLRISFFKGAKTYNSINKNIVTDRKHNKRQNEKELKIRNGDSDFKRDTVFKRVSFVNQVNLKH